MFSDAGVAVAYEMFIIIQTGSESKPDITLSYMTLIIYYIRPRGWVKMADFRVIIGYYIFRGMCGRQSKSCKFYRKTLVNENFMYWLYYKRRGQS